MTRILRALVLPTTLVATLALTACGTSSSNGSHGMPGSSGGTTNTASGRGTSANGAKSPAEVLFATGMIPHHAQAVTMASIALSQATDAPVRALAQEIKAAQAPEIARMSGWLTGWKAPVPAADDEHNMAGMGAETNGMMSMQEMTDLGRAAGWAFDRMWLLMMTRHHEGAVAMARTELAHGANPEAKTLAQSIIDSQTAEIAKMKSILNGLRG